MWAPLTFALLMGTAGSFSTGRVGVGVVFAVLLVGLLAVTAVRSRRSA